MPTPHRPAKRQDRSWAHCEAILSNAIGRTTFSLLENGQRGCRRSPCCATFSKRHPLRSPTTVFGAALEASGVTASGGLLRSRARPSFSGQTPEPGYMGQSDFTHADELGVTDRRASPFPHLLFTSSWSTSAGNTLASFLVGKLHGAGRETCSKPYWSLGGVAAKPPDRQPFGRFPQPDPPSQRRGHHQSAMMPSAAIYAIGTPDRNKPW